MHCRHRLKLRSAGKSLLFLSGSSPLSPDTADRSQYKSLPEGRLLKRCKKEMAMSEPNRPIRFLLFTVSS